MAKAQVETLLVAVESQSNALKPLSFVLSCFVFKSGLSRHPLLLGEAILNHKKLFQKLFLKNCGSSSVTEWLNVLREVIS